ncbi:MAG: ATP-binding protein [Ghiorsea sp.]|nr:ATP-binding protein [Ghiorsea sp.]
MLSLRFKDEHVEDLYFQQTKSVRQLQMRLSLLFVGILYGIFIYLDAQHLSEEARSRSILIHASQAIAFPLLAYLSLRIQSFFFHSSMVIVAVTIAWVNHLYLVNLTSSFILLGEAYLIFIWIWLVTGLSLPQASKLSLLFIIIYEINNIFFSPLSYSLLITQHFYIATSIIFGILSAYLIEYHKRHNFLVLKKLLTQTKKLRIANSKLEAGKKTLVNLSQAIEQSSEGILITDKHGMTEYMNPAFTSITGYHEEDMVGKISEVMNNNNKHIWKNLKAGQAWSGSMQTTKKDGTRFPTLVSITPMKKKGGKVKHYILTQQDMTTYQHLETQLRQAQKMEAVGTLIGGIAHDFNNSLTSITGMVYLAKKEIGHSPNTLEKLTAIENIAFQSSEMIKQLLAFSRKGVIHLKPISASVFLHDVSKLNRITLPKNITFKQDIDTTQTLTIKADANQLQQVIINLLNNAKDAVSHQHHPIISLHLDTWEADAAFKTLYPNIQHNTFVRITVSDNGHGIKKENLDLIFEPFYTTKDVHEGTGLGLSMAYSTAQSHGGGITVQSEWGKGTSFSLCLPRVNEESVVKPTNQHMLMGNGELILIVDDNQEVLSMGISILQNLGYQVISANNGLQAIDVYQTQQKNIKLVILDIAMPKMDGIEAAKQLRDINPNINIIFVTGYDPTQTLNTYAIPSEHILLKPFKISRFSQVIHHALYPKGGTNHD